jgi:hypothetical protein
LAPHFYRDDTVTRTFNSQFAARSAFHLVKWFSRPHAPHKRIAGPRDRAGIIDVAVHDQARARGSNSRPRLILSNATRLRRPLFLGAVPAPL